MIVHGIKCKKCGDEIYSRSRHDFRWCSCKSVAIDGGFDYTKITGDAGNFESIDIEVSLGDEAATKKALFDDWNKGENKYGLVKGSA